MQRLRGAFPDLMSKRLDQINAWGMEKWKAERKQQGTAASTINRDLTMLRAALGKAVDWDLLRENPLNGVKRIKGADNKRVRYLTSEEEVRLLGALERRDAKIRARNSQSTGKQLSTRRNRKYGDYLLPMVIVSMNTGLRYGELSRLKWQTLS